MASYLWHKKLLAMDKTFIESEHPRDEQGRFTEKGRTSIVINKDKLTKEKNLSADELRDIARDYYNNNLANTIVQHPHLGPVKFTESGHKKPISFSGDTRKLFLFPFLPEIIKNGKIILTEPDKKGRTNVENFYTLLSKITLENKELGVRITIREDDKGNLYYDHVINKNLGVNTTSTNVAGTTQDSLDTLSEGLWVVNIFFDDELENIQVDDTPHINSDAVSDFLEHRYNVIQWYRENLQGRTINHDQIGEILFNLRGIKHSIHKSDTDRLSLVKYLEYLITTGNFSRWENADYGCKNGVQKIARIYNTIIFNGKRTRVWFLLTKNIDGNLYYDLYLDKHDAEVQEFINVAPDGWYYYSEEFLINIFMEELE